jgi:hypothetical protein
VATATHTLWLGTLANDGYGRFHDPAYTDDALPAALRSGTVRVSCWLWWTWYGALPTPHYRPAPLRAADLRPARPPGGRQPAHDRVWRLPRVAALQLVQAGAQLRSVAAGARGLDDDPPAVRRLYDDAEPDNNEDEDDLRSFDVQERDPRAVTPVNTSAASSSASYRQRRDRCQDRKSGGLGQLPKHRPGEGAGGTAPL